MAAEESFLQGKFGQEFQRWSARVPSFLPNPMLWRKPNLPASFRNLLRREYTGAFVIVVCFTFMKLLGHWAIANEVQLSNARLAFLAAAAFLYVVLRRIKRKTTWFHVEGR